MQEIICFLNQSWIGTVVGTAGVALALFLYWRSRISGIIALQSRNVSMIAGGNPIFPDGVEVRYQGTPVPRLTSSTVWLWNAGKKTVSGSDIVGHDPLGLRFGGEVLNVRIKKVTRKVLRIRADTSKEENRTVCYGFEFLDPGDGGVLEVLHTGSPKAPECIGTIKGLPKGLQYWRSFISSKWERKEAWLMSIVGIIIGLEMTLGQHINVVFPFLSGEPESQAPAWYRIPFGLLLLSATVFHIWSLRHRAPSSLNVD